MGVTGMDNNVQLCSLSYMKYMHNLELFINWLNTNYFDVYTVRQILNFNN